MSAYHVHYTTGSGQRKGTDVDFTSTLKDLPNLIKTIKNMVDKGEAHSVTVHDTTVAGRKTNVTRDFVSFTTVPRRPTKVER